MLLATDINAGLALKVIMEGEGEDKLGPVYAGLTNNWLKWKQISSTSIYPTLCSCIASDSTLLAWAPLMTQAACMDWDWDRKPEKQASYWNPIV